MFTGIVEERGLIERFADGTLRVAATEVLADLRIGDSIAVNGCCLTAVARGDAWWEADVSDETISRTSLASASIGDPVNLERAVRARDRLGGHIVQGHVDGVGRIVEKVPDLRVRVPDNLLPYLAEKGSVAVDGVSLTVVKPLDDGFTVAVIPHTAAVTTLGSKQPGDLVNIEVDVIAKYVERMLAPVIAASNTGPAMREPDVQPGEVGP